MSRLFRHNSSVRSVCILHALLAALWLSPVVAAQTVQNRFDQILTDPALRSSRVGAIVIDARSGQTIAQWHADDKFIPASNMKLLTSGVALSQLGDDFVFRTQLLYDDTFVDDSGTVGRVILRGSGDPALADPKLLDAMGMTPEDVIQSWTDALKKAGVVGPVAELVIDDRIFDRVHVHPSWPVQQLNRWYCAEVSGLNFHTNLLMIFTQPQAPGQPPLIRTEPSAPWLLIRNRAKSVREGNHTAWAARALGSNRITLHGDVRWGTDPVELAMTDTSMFVARLLSTSMAAAGLAPTNIRLADPDERLDDGRVVHVITTDMETVLGRCNTDSYNLYAECLLKRLGYEMTRQPGSWSSGAALERMVLLEKIGPMIAQSLVIADGSGMSRENRVTPRLLAEWLLALIDDPHESAFTASLPSANLHEGTLRKRFHSIQLHNEVRAKTGYLSGVSAISGYVIDRRTQRRVVFSIITNDKPSSVRLALIRGLEENIVSLADQWLTQRTAARTVQAQPE